MRSLAADVVWFDAFTTNPDRTPRNANMLEWHGRIWLIDHGAALYFHHDWDHPRARATDPFERGNQHVLRSIAGDLAAADTRAHERLSAATFETIVEAIPDVWLSLGYGDEPPAVVRGRYLDYLSTRLERSAVFAEEAAGG